MRTAEHRTLYVRIFLSAICLGVCLLSARNYTSTLPLGYNVVLISIDSLRTDHMSLYGYERPTTPTIDAYAKGAAVFDNYFSTSMITPISEMSVQTGTYPFTSGLINFESILSPKVETLAEVLHAHGWKTASFGSSVEFDLPVSKIDFSRGFDAYVGNVNLKEKPLPWFGRNDSHIDEALAWARNASYGTQPFFLWLRIGSAHWPYGYDEPAHVTDPAYDGPMKADMSSPTEQEMISMFSQRYGTIWNGREYGVNAGRSSAGVQEDISYITDRYDDGIIKTDRELAPLLAFLSQTYIADRTIVIIESEHGEGLGERGYVAHYDISDDETHVPLIIKAPLLRPQNVQDLISGVDVFPTLMAALHLPQKKVDGINFLPRLSGASSTTPRGEIFLTRTPLWERILSTEVPWLLPLVPKDNAANYHDTALRTDEWKLVHRTARQAEEQYSWYGHMSGVPVVRPEYELYHMPTDPHETMNVYAEYPQIAEALKEKLLSWERITEGRSTIQMKPGSLQPYF